MTAAPPFPNSLLLDFGGVIVASEKQPDWQERAADRLIELIAGGAGAEPERGVLEDPIDPAVSVLPERARIVLDITAGDRAAELWRDAMSRPRHPRELDQSAYAMDFVAADWPRAARQALAPHVAELCYIVAACKERRELRDGIVELLEWCHEIGLPAAIVSNAMSGAVHRDYLREAGLSRLFAAELYSDEEGLRKPNPDFLLRGAAAVGCDVSQCWYVGDHYDRDVLCGVRAGVGATVLMPAPSSASRPYAVPVTPDVVAASPRELLHELQILHGSHGGRGPHAGS